MVALARRQNGWRLHGDVARRVDDAGGVGHAAPPACRSFRRLHVRPCPRIHRGKQRARARTSSTHARPGGGRYRRGVRIRCRSSRCDRRESPG